MPTPPAAVEHYKRMLRLQSVGVLAARRAWRAVDPGRLSESWRDALPVLVAALASVQEEAAVCKSRGRRGTACKRDERHGQGPRGMGKGRGAWAGAEGGRMEWWSVGMVEYWNVGVFR